MKLSKGSKIAGKFIFSGLFKSGVQILSGLIILRWINPEQLGLWHSFTVFTGYIAILNLGVTTGLNRELPYWIGKGNEKRGINLLKSAGAYVQRLGIGLILSTVILSSVFYSLNYLKIESLMFLNLAVLLTSLSFQGNLLGATFRSSQSFNKLANIQFVLSLVYIILIPLIYWFEIWGYIIYLFIVSLTTYLSYYKYRPYKTEYKFNKKIFYHLVKVGLPIFFWNYLNIQIQNLPRLILVLFGSPYLVGLFSPATSIKQAMLNLPKYTNRYLFPRMSHKLGSTNNPRSVAHFAFKASLYLLITTGVISVFLFLALDYLFPLVFPKYIDGLLAAKITIFTGVVFGINLVFHNAFNALKSFHVFKKIIGFKGIVVIVSTFLLYMTNSNLLFVVSLGALIAEASSSLLYVFYLLKITERN